MMSFNDYGHWCGPGNTGQPPVDSLDQCCEEHDGCYGLVMAAGECQVGPRWCQVVPRRAAGDCWLLQVPHPLLASYSWSRGTDSAGLVCDDCGWVQEKCRRQEGCRGPLMSDCAGVRGWPRLAAPRSAPATPACVTSPWPPASMRPTGAPRPCLDCLDETPVIKLCGNNKILDISICTWYFYKVHIVCRYIY